MSYPCRLRKLRHGPLFSKGLGEKYNKNKREKKITRCRVFIPIAGSGWERDKTDPSVARSGSLL